MKKLLHDPCGTGSETSKEVSAALGDVVRILMRCPSRRRASVAYFVEFVFPAFKHRQLKIFYDARGEPTAYVLWAFLADDINNSFKSKGPHPIEWWDWNDGLNFWIVDFVAPDGNLRTIVAALAKNDFAKISSVTYWREKGNTLRIRTLQQSKSLGWY